MRPLSERIDGFINALKIIHPQGISEGLESKLSLLLETALLGAIDDGAAEVTHTKDPDGFVRIGNYAFRRADVRYLYYVPNGQVVAQLAVNGVADALTFDAEAGKRLSKELGVWEKRNGSTTAVQEGQREGQTPQAEVFSESS